MTKAEIEALKRRFGSARIVVLGEATHLQGETSRSKVRMARFLAENLGFDVIAFEAGMLDAAFADRALADGVPPQMAARHLMAGGWDEEEDVAPLFSMLSASWHTGRPVHIAGFDTGRPPYGRAHAMEVLDSLCVLENRFCLGSDARSMVDSSARLGLGYMNAFPALAKLASREGAIVALRALEDSLHADGRHVLERPGSPTAAQVVAALREDIAVAATLGGGGDSAGLRWNRMRDQLMAFRVRLLVDSIFRGHKVIIWAATAHFTSSSAGIRDSGAVPQRTLKQAGDYLRGWYGRKLFTVAFTTGGGIVGDVFTDSERKDLTETHPLSNPEIGSIEFYMRKIFPTDAFVSLRSLPVSNPLKNITTSWALGLSPKRAVWPNVIDAFYFTPVAEPNVHRRTPGK